MKQITWHGGENFTADTVPDPVPQPGEVVVKIDTAGVCGTDVHITQGLFPSDPPKVLGHEFSGVISDVGQGVPVYRIGQRVVCDTTSHCSECEHCRSWSFARCERAKPSGGAFAEYSLMPASSAIVIDDSLSLEHASMTEPAACCLSGVQMLEDVKGKTALVVGTGAMGLFTIGFLRLAGAAEIIASEPVASRRRMAAQFGASVLHDPSERPLAEIVNEITNGRGVHIAIEAVGQPSLVGNCISVIRPKGQMLLIGVSPKGSSLPTDLHDMHYKEIVIRGAFGRGYAFAKTPEELAKLNLTGVISGYYPLEQAPQAIKDSASGAGIKMVVKPNGLPGA